MEKYKNIFHWNLQDASTISGEAIIFLHDYVMFYLIIIIVIIMILLVKIYYNYSYNKFLPKVSSIRTMLLLLKLIKNRINRK